MSVRSPSLYCTLRRKILTHIDLLSIQRIRCPPGKTTLHGRQSRSWSAEQGNIYRSAYATKVEKMTLLLSSFAPENVVSRDRSGGPVPRQPVAHSPHSRLNVVFTYGVPPYTVLLVRRTTPAAAESRACVQENCAINFYGFLGTAVHFVPLTNAIAALVLYCTGRFLKKKSEHI